MSKQLSEVEIDYTNPKLPAILAESQYSGAKPESIAMVIEYCKAANLDPLQKPVHIVPMWDKASGQMRDVIMAGISLYRIQASRSGQYGGTSEPEFGPTTTAKIGGADCTYPAWCKITVGRIIQGQIVHSVAKEFWIENYATKSKNDSAPNAMWRKRAFGQLAKCAEAQALRKAFPELCSFYTAEEMEGKELAGEIDVTPKKEEQKSADEDFYPQDKFNENLPS